MIKEINIMLHKTTVIPEKFRVFKPNAHLQSEEEITNTKEYISNCRDDYMEVNPKAVKIVKISSIDGLLKFKVANSETVEWLKHTLTGVRRHNLVQHAF